MNEFEFYLPKTLNEALEAIEKYRDDCSIVAGGTDKVIELKENKGNTGHVVAINKIQELKGMRTECGKVHIGALTTFSDLLDSGYVKTELKALYDTARYMGSPQIRNIATVGGNIANASVSADSPIALTAYDASVVLKRKNGTRTIKLTDFFDAPGKCQLKNDEILTEIIFDEPDCNTAVSYMKIGKRKALAIVVLGLSIFIKKDENNTIKEARIAAGAISPHTVRFTEIENALKGMPINKENLIKTLPMFYDKVMEMIPNRPSVVYKRECVMGAAEYCFEDILSQFKQTN